MVFIRSGEELASLPTGAAYGRWTSENVTQGTIEVHGDLIYFHIAKYYGVLLLYHIGPLLRTDIGKRHDDSSFFRLT